MTLEYILKKWNLSLDQEMPIRIPNTDRVTLTKLFAELGFKEGAEVGVQEGRYANEICTNNPGVKLHCVDAWEKYDGYFDFANPESYPKFLARAHELLDKHDCKFIQKYSMDAVKDFPDRSLDFVYIDANHEIRHVIEDIDEWGKKVKKGGILAGHDYFISDRKHNRAHVKYAVDAYTQAWANTHQRPFVWFVLGRDERLPGERRESSRSWFWVV